jgi:RecA/RadA recombinase
VLPFLKDFRKELKKLDNVSIEFLPPPFWYSTGNFALNKVLSGSYFKAVPQGRLSALVGPSAAGKSYILCSIIREAQKTGAFPLVIDSENALDPDFMRRAGINVDADKLQYAQVVTIQDVTKVISEFFNMYEKAYGKSNKEAPRLLIVLDSLGNCLTDGENEKFNKGVQTGDQGASAKNKKHLLRTLVSRLARYNTTFVFTDQVYPQDIMMGDGPWAVTNGVKYSASQIALLTKLKLKEDSQVVGIRMKVETYKSRFVKPGTKIELEIPFTTGLSPTSGLLEMLLEEKILTKEGYSFVVTLDGAPIKFKKEALTEEFARRILTTHPALIKAENEFEEFESNPMSATELIDPETGEITTEGTELPKGVRLPEDEE